MDRATIILIAAVIAVVVWVKRRKRVAEDDGYVGWTVPFRNLRLGDQFTIPYTTNPELIFEKIRTGASGHNSRSDFFDRWCSPDLHVKPLITATWNRESVI